METHIFCDQKVKVTSYKIIAGVGLCTLVSAGFFFWISWNITVSSLVILASSVLRIVRKKTHTKSQTNGNRNPTLPLLLSVWIIITCLYDYTWLVVACVTWAMTSASVSFCGGHLVHHFRAGRSLDWTLAVFAFPVDTSWSMSACHGYQWYTPWLVKTCHFIIRSTLRQSRPNKAGLKCPSVRAYVRTYVRPSTKSFFDFNEIWHVDRGRWVMHDSMQYDPSNSRSRSLALSPPPFTMGAGNWPRILKLGHNT